MPNSAQDLVAQARQEVQAITPAELIGLQNEKAPFTLIDVREREEWDTGHIDGAVHIPRGLLEFKIAEAVPDRHFPVILHCASGGRSALSAQMLVKMGYSNVKNLEGGYAAYRGATA